MTKFELIEKFMKYYELNINKDINGTLFCYGYDCIKCKLLNDCHNLIKHSSIYFSDYEVKYLEKKYPEYFI